MRKFGVISLVAVSALVLGTGIGRMSAAIPADTIGLVREVEPGDDRGGNGLGHDDIVVASPSAEPTLVATPEATADPTAKPTAKATADPTAKPTAKATADPTAKPTAKATADPTARPTATATAGASDDHGGDRDDDEPGDDHGGERDDDEPGDDHGGHGSDD